MEPERKPIPTPESPADRSPEGVADGDPISFDQLSSMWEELSQLAHRLRRQRNQMGHSYRTSDLLVSALRRLTGDAAKRWAEGAELTWENKEAFFASAATAMHRAIVDHIRSKRRDKRDGGRKRIPLDDGLLIAREDPQQALEVSECLEKLERLHPELAKVARLKIFTPMTNEALGTVLNVSDSTVNDRWWKAKVYLEKCLG